ncbi:MAG: tellurite resistance TerB family protein [Candidatus Thiodiazotropha sp. (ex Codakia rugifera)]|nr:tellurite resistance TerB family protein [Candidatus Thiodiazotropha sp. (ex Codakia rugifera)]
MDAIKILGSILNSGALSRGSGSNILGSVIGAMTGGGQSSGGGGLGNILGSMLGGGGSQSGGGGIGDIFGGGNQSSGQRQTGGGNIADILGGLMGGGAGGAGLGGLIGAAMSQFGGQRGGSPRASFKSSDHLPQGMQYQQATDQATLLIRAMINAAKADGQVDREEQQKIVSKLGEVTQDELNFVRNELAQPLDLDSFVHAIPQGMEQQVYALSLMAIDLDSNAEAQYLHKLAQATGITPQVSNMLHEQFGAQPIYKA